jgi:hypothetical protein
MTPCSLVTTHRPVHFLHHESIKKSRRERKEKEYNQDEKTKRKGGEKHKVKNNNVMSIYGQGIEQTKVTPSLFLITVHTDIEA